MDGRENDADSARQRPAPRPGTKVLRTGTYLHTNCPLCGAEMVEGDWIRFHAIGSAGEEGELRLSVRFNVFDQEATIPLKAGDQVRDLRCPRCEASLLDESRRCDFCGSRAVRIRITAVRTEITLLLCSRYGCHWHGVPEEDRLRLILEMESEGRHPPGEGAGPSPAGT